jgi:aromatic-L-amino-acid decarboxylase
VPEEGDISPDEFRRVGHELIEWIAEYFAHPERYPVLSRVAPGEVTRALPESAPDEPEAMEAFLHDFEETIVPGITHWNHPGFFAYFAISGSAPGVLGELLAAALNVNAMLWRTSPAATELEEVTLDWLRQLLELPDGFRGVIYDTASVSSLVAMAAAREAAGLGVKARGLAGLPPMRVYCSDQAHSSIEKAAITLGLGRQGTRIIPSDAAFRMEPAALRAAIERDIAAGDRPIFVAATVGTTATTSVDPVPAIADICDELGLWLHVDGAYGGSAAILPEMRGVWNGVARADSIVVNPHKWLFTPIDCSAFFSRRLEVVRETFTLVPEILRTSEQEVTNYMDYGVQLGRRFRALKLWFVLRAYGRRGITDRLREHIRLAHQLEGWVQQTPEWQVVAPVPFSTVCFQYAPTGLDDDITDRLNARIVQRVNETGEVFLSGTKLRGREIIRLAIGHIRTGEEHVRRAWDLLQQAALLERSALAAASGPSRGTDAEPPGPIAP